MRGLGLLLSAALLLSSLSGCAYDPTVDQYFYMNIASEPTTLDPQTATDKAALTVIGNCFEGLMRFNEDGEPEPAGAVSYTVSEDGLVYTFRLDEDARWHQADSEEEENPVTARDYVFAFQRLFDPETRSENAENYTCILNAQACLDGECPTSLLGVTATGDYTLKFTLSTPCQSFLSLLAAAPAMPCCESFFTETQGRYGLEAEELLCNGPFYVSAWEHDYRVVTRRNLYYSDASQVYPAGVSYYVSEESEWLAAFRTGETDCVRLSGYDISAVKSDGYEIYEQHNRTWVLALNPNSGALKSEKVRIALAKSLDRVALSDAMPSYLEQAEGLVPEAVTLGDTSYRSLAGESVLIPFDSTDARDLFLEGLAELGLEGMTSCTMLVPDTGTHSLCASAFQGIWQNDLLVFVNIESLPTDTILSRMSSGDWDMAVFPVSADFNDPSSVFRSLPIQQAAEIPEAEESEEAEEETEEPEEEAAPLPEEVYAEELEQLEYYLTKAAEASDVSDGMRYYLAAEKLLTDTGLFVPLYSETTAYAVGRETYGISVSTFGGQVFYASARKK